jgi:predicted ATP-dependent serine protease
MDKPDYLEEADEDDFAQLVEAARKRRPAAAPVTAAAPAAPPHDTARVELQSAASIAPQAIEWLWPGWLARGRLHLLAGQPGAGKTTLALEFAAIYLVRRRVAGWRENEASERRHLVGRGRSRRHARSSVDSCRSGSSTGAFRAGPASTVDREGLIRRGT